MRRAAGVIEPSMSSARSRRRTVVAQPSQACRAIDNRTRPSAVSTGDSSRPAWRIRTPHSAHAGALPSDASDRYAASRPSRAADSAVRRMRRSTSAGWDAEPSPDTDAATSAAAYLSIAAAISPFLVSNSRLRSLRSSATVPVAIAGILRSSDIQQTAGIERPRWLHTSSPKIGNRRLAVTHQGFVVHPLPPSRWREALKFDYISAFALGNR